MSKGEFTFVIDEIVYTVPLCRAGVVPLRWLDKPAREYFVHHHDDGKIEMRPLGERSYVVKATDDGVLHLRETEPGAATVEVRHEADGSIWIRQPETSLDPEMLRILTRCVEGDATWLGHRSWDVRKARYMRDDWNRTHADLGRAWRWRDEFRERHGPERWAELEADEACRRAKARAYRERRKASAGGLLPSMPRPAKSRPESRAVSAIDRNR